MVNLTDNQTVISTQDVDNQAQPSFKRWVKHSFSFKSSHRLFNAEQREQIAQAISQAEDGHRGEIQVVIEGSLPSHIAYHEDTLQRARYVFAKYRVWDTEQNTGLLIYLNLCAHQVEIVTDRGIDAAVEQQRWHEIVQEMTPYFKDKKFTEGLCVGVTALGEILQKFYQDDPRDLAGNELSNTPKFL